MLILGFVLFTFLVLGTTLFLYKEGARQAELKRVAADSLRHEVEDAMKRKDVNGLKRIRLMNSSALEDIDPGLGQRIDEYTDELYIENHSRK